jgi:imidazolonepropionase-like amidohydrolase
LLTVGNLAGGGVIHQLGWSGLDGPLPSLLNNSEIRIRAGVRASVTQTFLNRAIATLAVLLFVCSPALAETLLLSGATIHTLTGKIIAAGDVLVQDGKIKDVFDVTQPARTRHAKIIDLKGLHLYPGLIALNTELGLVEIGAIRATRDDREVGEFTPEVQSWLAVNPDSELLAVARANGVAYFEPVPLGALVAGQSGLLALDGWTSEQMTVKKAIALHVFWPGMGLDTTPKERAADPKKWKSLEDQAKEHREKLKALEDFFDEARAYAKAKGAAKDPAAFRKVPAWEAMLPVVRSEVPITIHADDVREIRAAVKWAESNHLKIVLAEARDAWRVASLLASNNVPVIYNHVFTQPSRDSDAYDAHFAAPAVLQKAGVKVVFGLSGDRSSLVKNLPYDAAQAVAFGLPAEEALKGLTLYPAQLAGVADRLGSIEASKDATLFAADGDILDIRSNVKRMWIAGKEISLESRHTRFYEKYKNRPKAASAKPN